MGENTPYFGFSKICVEKYNTDYWKGLVPFICFLKIIIRNYMVISYYILYIFAVNEVKIDNY